MGCCNEPFLSCQGVYSEEDVAGNEILNHKGLVFRMRFPGQRDFVEVGEVAYPEEVFDYPVKPNTDAEIVVEYAVERWGAHDCATGQNSCPQRSGWSPAKVTKVTMGKPTTPTAPCIVVKCPGERSEC